ncbi:MAG: type II toxin-antitoxin system HicA family toxin [Methanobacterium formicicum]
MNKLPRVTASKVIKVLESTGFVMVRQSGSHKIFKNKKGVRITVPYHSGKVIHPKILKRILDDADLNIESFKELSK